MSQREDQSRIIGLLPVVSRKIAETVRSEGLVLRCLAIVGDSSVDLIYTHPGKIQTAPVERLLVAHIP